MRFLVRATLSVAASATVSASAQSFDWLATVAGGGSNAGTGVVTDSHRNVISTGTVINVATLGPGGTISWVLSGNSSYAYKLSETRDFLWYARVENSAGAPAVSVDRHDNLVLGTSANTPLTIVTPALGPALPISTPNGTAPALLWKLGPDGATHWVRTFAASSAATVSAVTTRSDDSIVAAGRFSGTIELGATPGSHALTSAGGNDIFVVALDADGNFLWCRQLGGSADQRVPTIATTPDDDVVLGGTFSGSASFDDADNPVTLVSAGGIDGFIARLGVDGSLRWAGNIGGTGDDAVRAIAVDIIGTIALAGSFSASADLDPSGGDGSASAHGMSDLFVELLDEAGEPIWTRTYGGTGNDTAAAVAFGSGSVYVGGAFSASLNFDPDGAGHVVSASGADDGYVMRLGRDGSFKHVVTFGGTGLVPGSDNVAGLTIDSLGAVLATGGYAQLVDFDPASDTSYYTSNDSSFPDGFVWKLEDAGALIVQPTIETFPLPFGATTLVQLHFTSTLDSDLSDLGIEQTLPPQLRIAADAAAGDDCGGQVTALPGAAQFSLRGAVLASGASCTINVAATATTVGSSAVELLPLTIENAEGVWPLQPASTAIQVVPAVAALQLDAHTPNPSLPGQPVEFGVSVMPAAIDAVAATGQIVVGDGSETCTIVLPAAACSIVFATAGSRALAIHYSGDTNYLAAAASTSQEVLQATPTLNLDAQDPNPSLPGQAVTFAVSVMPPAGVVAAATGQIVIGDGIQTCTILLPATGCSIAFATAGARTLNIDYSGDANYRAAATSTSQGVSAILPTLQLDTHDPNPSLPGQAVIFGVRVVPPAGAIPVVTGQIVVGGGSETCTIVLPATSCIIAFTTPGPRVVDVAYSGDGNYLAATTSTAHEVDALMDLSIDIVGVPPTWPGGSVVDFDIVVANAGPNDAIGTTMASSLPDGASWACLSGCNGSGSGNVALALTLASGVAATVHVTATIPALPEVPIAIAANVEAGANEVDSNEANNQVARLVTVVLFRDGFD